MAEGNPQTQRRIGFAVILALFAVLVPSAILLGVTLMPAPVRQTELVVVAAGFEAKALAGLIAREMDGRPPIKL